MMVGTFQVYDWKILERIHPLDECTERDEFLRVGWKIDPWLEDWCIDCTC